MGDERGTATATAEAAASMVVDELRQLMSLRSRSSVRDRACPMLVQLLDPADRDDRDRRFAALTGLLDDAIEAIDDEAHRSAARALLGSGPGRWRTVAQRGADAAAAFSCGWDAYRRRRASGSSQLDDTLEALAGSVVAIGHGDPSALAGPLEPAGPATPATSTVLIVPERTAPEPSEGAASRGRVVTPRHVALVVLAAAVVAAVTVAATAALRPDGNDRAQNPACDVLQQPIGAVSEAADAELREWASRFRDMAPRLNPEITGCAGYLERRWGLVMQPVADADTHGVGALVSSEVGDPHVIHMSHYEWLNYETQANAFGAEMIGEPVRRADRADGTRVVELTRGALVGEAPPTTFVVTGRAWQDWLARGGIDGEMGSPVSNMRDLTGVGRVQDFEHGRLVLDHLDPTVVEWEPLPNPGALLPSDVFESVLVSVDRTAWYVDEHGVRHWMPTGSDLVCAQGLVTDVHHGVRPQAIATLTAGEPFRCR